MKIIYHPKVDVVRILFSSAPIEESDEDKPGVILDYSDCQKSFPDRADGSGFGGVVHERF